ncbi:hypothetical protein GCM10011490_10530 [Pseudoclavibacter endophyticus]|uniref:Uncharacterized protein n=1 Tax=Pseudoclavibacter endophyticus TaxID=1778590 RepID=A0A6H9WF05_9MICO|nr:hypothetical protein [Pseudoclavibacter endophyticus]KAB1649509.1 hypothetical protein F8O04_04420 [Pseudoclavibacter endophyticus]GGA62049.1 hypothetical protein GCM10011490_10530 [Pseudoclavibacter endophyticus]
MSGVRVVAEPFSPPPLRRADDFRGALALAGARQRRSRVAGAPAVAMLVLGWAAAVAYWIPELPFAMIVPGLFEQFLAAVPSPVFTGGAALFDGAPDAGVGSVVAFASAVALGFVARQGGRARYAVAPLGVVLAAAAVPIVTVSLQAPLDRAVSLFVGASCVVVGALVALNAARGRNRPGVHPYSRRTFELRAWRRRWLIAYLVVVPLPLAVGRAIACGELRDRAAEIARSESVALFMTLLSPATPLAYLLGAALGVAAWAALRCVPPLSELTVTGTGLARRLAPSMKRPAVVAPAIVVVAMLVAGLAAVAPMARDTADETVATTYASVPADGRDTCATVVLAGSSPQLGLRPGAGCVGLASYAGYVQTGVAQTNDDYGSASGSTTPEGEAIGSGMAGAVYEPVFVVAGADGGSVVNVMTAFSFDDASIVWRFACPGGEPFTFRFAGSAAGDRPATGRLTLEGEPEAVFVGCANGVYRLDPRTGGGF